MLRRILLAIVCGFLPLLFLPGALDPYCTPRMLAARIVLTMLVLGLALSGEGFARPRLTAPIVALIALWALSTLFSAAPSVSVFGEPDFFVGLLNLVVGVGLFVCVYSGFAKTEAEDALFWASLGVAALAAYGVAQKLGYPFLNALVDMPMFDWTRSDSTFGNPAPFTMYLLAWWPVVGVLAARSLTRDRRRAVYYGVLSSLIAFSVFAANSRLGILLLGVEIMLVGWMLWPLVRSRRKEAAVFAALIVVAAVAFQVRAPGNPLAGRVLSGAHGAAVRARSVIWRTSLPMVADDPALGVGPGMFKFAYYRDYYPLDFMRTAEKLEVTAPHNFWLQMAIEDGLPALAIFLWMAVAIVWAAAGAGRGWSAVLGRAFVIGAVGMLVLSGTTMFEVTNFYLLFIWLALAEVFLRPSMEARRSWRPPKAARVSIVAALALLAAVSAAAAFADVAYKAGLTAPSPAKATQSLELAARLSPWDSRVYDALAKNYATIAVGSPAGGAPTAGGLGAAEGALARAVALNPLDMEAAVFTPEMYFYVAQSSRDPGQARELMSRAKAGFEKLVATARHDRPYGLLMLGEIAYGRNDTARAVASWKEAVRLAPDYREPYLSLERAYLAVGKKKLAEEAGAKAEQLGRGL